MATNVPGDAARLFPWQVMHYYQRGGPNDPITQAALQTPGPHWVGGTLSWNSVLTFPPLQPTAPTQPITTALPQQQPRTMSINSGCALTVGTGAFTGGSGVGGILVGTIPGGSWIDDVQIFCYEGLTVGTSVSAGLFYAPANAVASPFVATAPQPNTMYSFGYITNPAANTLYSSKTRPANLLTSMLTAALTGYAVGPGRPQTPIDGITLASNGPPGAQGFSGMAQAQASGGAVPTPASGDIDVYFATFLTAGSGTAPSTGSFTFLISFTGQEG